MTRRNIFQTIVMTMMLLAVSVQTAWAQETAWDGTNYSFAENKFADEGLTVDGHDGKSWEKAYVITTARQFAYFAWIVKNNKTGRASAYYWKLGADINLGGHDWTVFGGNAGGAFQGHFDGGGFTISNVKLDVTTNSNYGLFTTIQGAGATTLAEVKNLKISGVTFTSDASRANTTRLGALAGYVKQANITNVSVSNVTFTYSNTITNTNQLGGAIGCMENNTTLNNVDATGVTASFAAATTKLYFGGVVGQSGGTQNTNSMTGCDAKTIKVIHTSNITGETQLGGLVGQASTSLSTISNNTVEGVGGQNDGKGFDVSVTGTTASLSVGGLLGYATGNASSTISVTGCHAYECYISHTGAVSSANIGGLIGSMSNYVTVASSNAKGVYATFNNTTTSLYLGGLVGQSSGGTANTNSVTGNTVNTVKVTHNNNITGTTYMGGLVGNAQANLNVINNNTVAGVEGKNDGKAFDVSVSGTTVNFYAGGLLGCTKGDGHEVKGNCVEKIYITNTGTINGGRLGGFIGYVESDNTTSKVLVKGNTATTVNIQVDGNTVGTPYLGGFIGQAKGKASPNNRSTIEGNTVTSAAVTMNGEVGHTFYQGGFLGCADAHTNLFNNKVETPNISITNTINAATYVGGAVGYQANYTTIDGMTVTNGSINGPSAVKTVKNNTNFMVGGFIGQQNSSGTVAYQPNIFKNIAVTGININLEKYQPAGNISNHKFSVGGIAGCVNAPNKDVNGFCGMPENIIFKGGRIYAPYATTSPTVASFNNSNPSHNTLTTEVITTIDALDKARTKTWYYNDYELGLSPGLLKSSVIVAKGTIPSAKDQFRLNCTATLNSETVQYITINGSTFQNQNRFQDSERDSKTVLWWTTTAAVNATKVEQFTKEEQPIYPYQAGATATTYPYYWYFFQGVMNANYVTSDVATKIIAGIAGNKTESAKEHPITLTISNPNENERGFADRTLTVKAVSNETDVTGSYTYQWYVNGKADGTSTTKTLTPHWKDGQGITVNALNGSAVVATATYTLAPGVLKTKAGSSEKIRSDINGRGTKANPYIIDCENALRQWSYLSTAQTGNRWEDIVMPTDPMTSKASTLTYYHYNRGYYELGADITMGSEPFIPISHVGYSSDGTYGTYSNNFIFQGNFDGKGYKISGLKITWGAGQYNGNGTNIYFGLFGAVGHSTQTTKWGDGTTLSNTVIKNLIIDGAVLTHDTDNTTFSYKKDYTHITGNNFNNCMVGVLAGIVNDYTTIQNIDIRNSKITDETTTKNYDLATQGLYVGGAIGSVQRDYKTTGTAIASVDIQHIVANVDITLTYPKFTDATAKAQVGLFNVGGIVGRYMATSATKDQMQDIMPKYTLYSGTVNAEKAWISPVIGATRFKDQNGGEFKHFSKQWEGNNADAASQIKVTNAQYYNFKIYYDGGNKDITEDYPSNKCRFGFRVMNSSSHADGQDDAAYVASKYQGVNYDARYVAENSTLELLNKKRTDGYSFVWDGTVVKMTQAPYVGISLVRDAEVSNKFTAVMEGVDPVPETYKWQVSFDSDAADADWYTIDDTDNEYTVPVSLKTKYVKVSTKVDEITYTTLYEIVEADKNLCNPKIIKGGTEENPVFSFALNQKVTDPAPELTASYEWYKTNTVSSGVSNANLTLTKDELTNTYNNVVFCKVTVTEHGVQVAEYSLVIGGTVIYVNGNGYTGTDEYGKAIGEGKDTNNGLTPQTPVKTIDKANALLKTVDQGGTIDNNYIVIMGILNNDYIFRSSGENPATLTGMHGGHDYEGVIRLKQIFPSSGEHYVNAIDTNKKGGTNCYVLGDTKFEDLTFYGMQEGNSFIELHGRDAIFGKGLVMQNFKDLSNNHGNLNNSEVIPEFTIILYATNLSAAKINEYTKRIHDRGTPQTVTFQSGHYGRLMGGRFTQNFFPGGTGGHTANTARSILGSAEYPVWAVVNVEIDADNEMTDKNGKTYSRDINAVITGLTDGSMYGDYTINFYGGNVAYIVGANQGNPVKNGTETYKPLGGTSGSFGQFPNASFFGRSVINIDQKSDEDSNVKPITVGNLYAGGLGRMAQAGDATAAVDMYVYGQTEVNVKNGTVSGSVYGGGVGGVIGSNPWDAHVPYATTAADNLSSAIANKVQYGDTRYGTWSSKVKGTDAMAQVTIHKIKEDGSGYESVFLDLDNSSTTVNISGGTVNGNVYGGGYGYVQDMPYEAAVQGVGSVFGTTNVNVSGGKIKGNVYGGSQGHKYYYGHNNKYQQSVTHIAEMNGTVNVTITGGDIGGDIYGAGQGIDSEGGNDYETIATTGNATLGDEYKSVVNINIELPEDKKLNSNIYGGGRLGAVDGVTNVNIISGQVLGNVYGGGKGEKGHLQKARVKGTTNVTLGK